MRLHVRALNWWEKVRTSYWFVPALMVTAAIGLSLLTLWIDGQYSESFAAKAPWFYSGSSDGARELLSMIAGSMIGIAGVVFSITIVALTLASSQFGPRLLRNFMRDTGNQIVFGTFTAIFMYCLMILRTVRSNDDDMERFLPQISLLVALILASIGVGVLIYFIHHTAASIQVANVIINVVDELEETIDDLYPQRGQGTVHPEELGEPALPATFDHDACPLLACSSGYIQRIDLDELVHKAKDKDLLIRVQRRPGHFVQGDTVIADVFPPDRANEDTLDSLRSMFVIAAERSLAQDVEFAIDQLLEIAMRALSPSLNDPYTAINAADRLGEALTHLAGCALPSPRMKDDAGQLRVVAYPIRMENFMDSIFGRLRQNAQDKLSVLLRLLEVMQRLAPHLCTQSERACLLRHAQAIEVAASKIAHAPDDEKAIATRYHQLLTTLNAPPSH